MQEPIVLPAMGLVEEVTLSEWLVEDGQTVAKGDRLLIIETEKTSTELEAPAGGVVRIAVPAGPELVRLDAVLGYIETENG